MTKQAVIVVDLQNDYLGAGRFALEGIDTAVKNAAAVIAQARDAGVKVVNVRHENPAGAPFFEPGTQGTEIIGAVEPQADDALITKNHPNSFRETNLKELLETDGIKDVVVVGAMSHMCIDATARAAADHGFRVTVVADACATRDLEFQGKIIPAAEVHAAYMSALGFAYAEVKNASDIVFG